VQGDEKKLPCTPSPGTYFLKKPAAFQAKEILILRALAVLHNAVASRFLTLWHHPAKKACLRELTPVQGSPSFSFLST